MSTPAQLVTTTLPDHFLAHLLAAIEAARPTGMEEPVQILVQFGDGEVARPCLVARITNLEWPHPRMPLFQIRLEWHLRNDESTDLIAARAAWHTLQRDMPALLATAATATRQQNNARLRYAMPAPEDDEIVTTGWEFSSAWQIRLIQM